MKLKRCPVCRGMIVSGKTTFTSDLGFGVVVVRQVPAQVCDQCGESWLSDDTSEGLEHIVNDIRQKQSMVEVLNWHDAERLAA